MRSLCYKVKYLICRLLHSSYRRCYWKHVHRPLTWLDKGGPKRLEAEVIWLLVFHLKDIIHSSFYSGMDFPVIRKYSALLQSCLWSKELPFQPPEGRSRSRPGSRTSYRVTDQDLKGLSCFTYDSHINININIISISHCFSDCSWFF